MTGQHVTTVRFHLDVLTRKSLVRQVQQPPRGRGRPRIGYSAVQRSFGYLELAQVLADQLGSDPLRRLDAAIAAGRAWAAKLSSSDEDVRTVEDARAVTLTKMAELGFAPEKPPTDDGPQGTAVVLTACPMRELARNRTDVVCGVHLGLLRGIIDNAGGRGRVEASLHPFVDGDQCVARLHAARSNGRVAPRSPVSDRSTAGRP